ncbi:MAG: sulfurtransferase TusA family protein [Nitrospira sp.]|nr:MAG: sulfurtransferase TusA family protein [Nitrospira sp.]
MSQIQDIGKRDMMVCNQETSPAGIRRLHPFGSLSPAFSEAVSMGSTAAIERGRSDSSPSLLGSRQAVLYPTPEVKPALSSVAAPAASGAPVYDLRGVACPLNYVKTKLKLEMMDAGEQLEVWLDAGEPIKNVPLSLKNDGHKLLLQEPLEAEAAHYRILVEKVE